METKKDKVVVTNLSDSRVGVSSPELHFRRQWLSRGASVRLNREDLEDLMYDPGFKYMIDNGILFIEDMKVKQELGIEPEDATEPVNVIKLTEKEMRDMMTITSLTGFKEKIKKLTHDQLQYLADFSIENNLVDFEKCEIIKKVCGRDVINTIRLSREDEPKKVK